MKALQWSMTIPKVKQAAFVSWFNEIAGPVLGRFGAVNHELFKVVDQPVIGKKVVEENRFIERVYFNDDFDLPSYFTRVKADSEAWQLSRMYEAEFGAREIELRLLKDA